MGRFTVPAVMLAARLNEDKMNDSLAPATPFLAVARSVPTPTRVSNHSLP